MLVGFDFELDLELSDGVDAPSALFCWALLCFVRTGFDAGAAFATAFGFVAFDAAAFLGGIVR